MKRSLAIPAALILILAAAAIVLWKKDDPEVTADNDSGEKKEKVEASRPSAGGPSSAGRSGRAATPRTSRQSREGELVERYGRVRTARAREVSQNVVAILDDVISVGEMMMKGGQEFGGARRGMVNGVTRRMGIELSEEQQAEALAIYDEWQKSELEKSKKAVLSLRDDPSAMMELFLAGDAKERGDLDESDYADVRDSAAGELADIINPLDRNNFRGDRRMASDKNLMNSFAEILDPEQAEKFFAYQAEREASGEQSEPRSGNITTIPTMELETLDKAVGNAQKMTTGFRSLMEGMGAMRELQPQIEPGSGDGE